MRRLWIAAAALSLVLLSGTALSAAEPAGAPQGVGVLDVQRVLREAKAARQAQALFRREVEEKRALLQAKEREARALEADLRAKDAPLTEVQRREKGEKLAQEIKELGRLRTDLDEELKKRDLELTRKLIGEIRQVVQALQKSDRLPLVLERGAVFAADEAIDITDRVIRLYDAREP